MKIITLTVFPRTNNQFGLRLEEEMIQIAPQCTDLVLVLNNNISINIIDAIQTYNNQGRISHPELNQWIIQNNLNNYPQGEPTKLIFTLIRTGNRHKYVFYPYQANLMNQL